MSSSNSTLNLAGAGILAFIAYKIIAKSIEIKPLSLKERMRRQMEYENNIDTDTHRTLNIPGRAPQTSGSSRF